MSKLQKAQTQQGHSKHFFEFIRAIGESKSKQEEDRIVSKDIVDLKKSMSEKNVDRKHMKEYVVRMFYSEMLGTSAEFGHIHAVNLASSADLLQKRTGYLATWLCVSPESELMYLIVASLQRDMRSNSYLEVAAALSAACKLIKPELLPAIYGEVSGLLNHTQSIVRKRATIAMHSFFKQSDGTVGESKHFRQALGDKDPSVMGASLPLFLDVALADPIAQRELIPSFISILKQITEHRLSREYEYHRVPAPWMQIALLKLLAILAADNEALSLRCKDVILETMKRADTGMGIGHAIIFQCISTITSIYPITELLEVAAEFISKLLSSQTSNLRYLGIRALSRIVKIDPKYAQEHQHIVIECLEDPDDTIRRMTITLLFAMCNENNVEAICSRLIKFLSTATDKFLRQDMVRNICDVADRFNTSPDWYVETMNQLLIHAPEHVTQTTIQGMLKVIAEGEGEDEEDDAAFRAQCVEDYFDLMDGRSEKPASPALVHVAAWVMGEYGFLSKKVSRLMMIDRLCDMLERQREAETKCWIVTAMMKLVAFCNKVPENVVELIQKFQASKSVALQQRCYEFAALTENLAIMRKVLPLDGCCEDIEVDENMSFLNALVDEALSRGAKPYQKKNVNLGPDEGVTLRTDAYKTQEANVVDEHNLDKDRFDDEKEQEQKLVIKESAKRWGRQNLDENGVEGGAGTAAPTLDNDLPPVEDSSAVNSDNNNHGQQQQSSSSAAAAVEAVPEKHRPTKNEKFLNDIFSGGGKKKAGAGAKKTGGARAKAALERAAAAEEAQRNLDEERENDDESPAPSAYTTTTTTAPVNNNNKQHADPLGDLLSGAAKPQTPAPSSSGAAKPLNVEFNFQKQHAPDALLIRVGMLNKTGAATNGPTKITFTAPAGFGIDIQPVPGATIEGTSITTPPLPASNPVFLVIRVKVANIATGFAGLNVAGQPVIAVSVTSSGSTASNNTGCIITPVDILRPVPGFTTEMFGKNWVAMNGKPGERKIQMKFTETLTPEKLQKQIGERAALKIISVSGAEAIATSKLIGADNNNMAAYVFVLMAVQEKLANTTVRCADPAFGGIVADTLAK
jgi:AP-4 complex subunit epsilon-1